MVLKFSFIAFQIGMQTHYYVVQDSEDLFLFFSLAARNYFIGSSSQ